MIHVRSLRKRYGRLEVLRGLDLDIRPGRVTAVVGPNGAGKSTLIRILLGLVRADGGTIMIGGVPIGDDPAYRTRIGYMPQTPRFPENLSGREVLAMLADLRGPAARVDDELLSAFRLESEIDKRLGTLSAGTRQKVNALIAFAFGPDLLILDEPTAGLDPVAAALLKDRIRRERNAGRTILLTTHVMSEVEEMADEVVFLLDGSVRFVSTPVDVMHQTGESTLERGIARLMRDPDAPQPVRDHAISPGGRAA
jgi:Cu-processing system ATP-binding protein